MTFRGEILFGPGGRDREVIAAFESTENFRHAIAHYGGFEQRDIFE